MNAGVAFTEKYLRLMFKSLRDASTEEVMAELEHCRRENRRPVRVPRYFRGYFNEEKFHASTDFEMQVFRHENAARNLIFYIHGGAFIYPPVFFHWRFLHDLCLRTHYDALMPVYPKSPDYDCAFAVKTLLEFYKTTFESNYYEKIHLVGDSAGAHLCLVVAQEAHKNGWQQPDTITLLSPCVDLSYSREQEMRALQDLDPMLQLDRIITLNAIWQGKLPATHPWVSPIFGDFSGIDNLNVYYGTNEILKPDTLFLEEVYKKAGKTGLFHEYKGMFHTFPLFPVPQGFAATKEISNILTSNRIKSSCRNSTN